MNIINKIKVAYWKYKYPEECRKAEEWFSKSEDFCLMSIKDLRIAREQLRFASFDFFTSELAEKYTPIFKDGTLKVNFFEKKKDV